MSFASPLQDFCGARKKRRNRRKRCVQEAERIVCGCHTDRLLILEARQERRTPQRLEPEAAGIELDRELSEVRQ